MADEPFPVFGPDGTLLGNLTSNFGQQPATNPDLLARGLPQSPFSGGLNYLPGNNVDPKTRGIAITPVMNNAQLQGSTINSGAGGGTFSVPGAGGNPNTAATNPIGNAKPTDTGALAPGSLGDYFARTIIIVLGFIFVAVGLNMLRPGTVPDFYSPPGLRH